MNVSNDGLDMKFQCMYDNLRNKSSCGPLPNLCIVLKYHVFVWRDYQLIGRHCQLCNLLL